VQQQLSVWLPWVDGSRKMARVICDRLIGDERSNSSCNGRDISRCVISCCCCCCQNHYRVLLLELPLKLLELPLKLLELPLLAESLLLQASLLLPESLLLAQRDGGGNDGG